MAYDDALFQLGMDLTRSSTAQKEDLGLVARVAHTAAAALGQRRTRTIDVDVNVELQDTDSPVAGHHLIIDLMGGQRLDDLSHIERTLRRCVDASGVELLHVHLNRTSPGGGVSGVALLADSHISIYTRPHAGYAALDVFMPGDAKPERVIPILREAFQASDVVSKLMQRGGDVVSKIEIAPVSDRVSPVIRQRQPDTGVRERLRKSA